MQLTFDKINGNEGEGQEFVELYYFYSIFTVDYKKL